MSWLYWLGYIFFNPLFFLCRGKVSGKENVPKNEPFILASNHISYFDPPLLGSMTGREVYFFAKRELFNNKFIGFILYKANARSVRRGVFDRGAIDTSVQILDRGYGLVVFPEGTRSSTDEFLPTKPGVGMIACQAKVAIVPTFINGSDGLWDCLFGRKKLRVAFGEPLTKEYIGSFETEKESYKAITDEIMKRIKVVKEKTLSPN